MLRVRSIVRICVETFILYFFVCPGTWSHDIFHFFHRVYFKGLKAEHFATTPEPEDFTGGLKSRLSKMHRCMSIFLLNTMNPDWVWDAGSVDSTFNLKWIHFLRQFTNKVTLSTNRRTLHLDGLYNKRKSKSIVGIKLLLVNWLGAAPFNCTTCYSDHNLIPNGAVAKQKKTAPLVTMCVGLWEQVVLTHLVVVHQCGLESNHFPWLTHSSPLCLQILQ